MAALLAIAACSPQSSTTSTSSSGSGSSGPHAPAKKSLRPIAPGESTIARADYIGPEACGECHAQQYAQWTTSLHRVMNARVDDPKAVIGDFENKTLAYAGGKARFERTPSGYAMIVRKGDRETRYRITRTIGRARLQEYVGVEEKIVSSDKRLDHQPDKRLDHQPDKRLDDRLESPDKRSDREKHGDEVRLPFGWWPRYGGWAPQPSFDPWLDEHAFDAYAPVREPWAERCPWCHSTYPFAQRIARASGPRAVGHGFEQYFVSTPGTDRLATTEQVTTGISCESCHLGGRAHADGAAIDFVPRGAAMRADAPPFPTTFAAQREDATVINGVCAQCHSGPSPRLSDGTSLRNSSEALDLGASSCKAKCTDCHDPHLGSIDEAKSNAACASCHATQAQPQHAGKGHATTTCMDCHMPKVVMGIDTYVRTHRISSPTNAALYAEAAPNACNLCHLDRTIEWTLAALREGWDVGLGIETGAYGDDNVGDVWLASTSPSIRLVAIMAYARSPLARFVRSQIEKNLTDSHAYVRAWTKLALDEINRRGSSPSP